MLVTMRLRLPRASLLGGLPGLFVTSLLVGFSGALVPGPLFAAVVAGAAASGFWAGPALVAGHGVLELAIVVALALGLGPVLRRPAVTRAIAGAGGVTLIWLGWTMVSDGLAQRVVADMAPAGAIGLAPVALGVVVSASNPYWVLWWATIGAGYVAIALHRGLSGITAFYTGHILSDLSWYAAVALAVANGRAIASPAIYNWVIAAAGLFLAAMGLLFLRAAVSRRLASPAPAPAVHDPSGSTD
jgi:threonine/homoserine/homoserine lactone efflux protein